MCETNIANWCEFHFDYAIFQYSSPYLYQIHINGHLRKKKHIELYHIEDCLNGQSQHYRHRCGLCLSLTLRIRSRGTKLIYSIFFFAAEFFVRWSIIVHSIEIDRIQSRLHHFEMPFFAISHAQKITRSNQLNFGFKSTHTLNKTQLS